MAFPDVHSDAQAVPQKRKLPVRRHRHAAGRRRKGEAEIEKVEDLEETMEEEEDSDSTDPEMPALLPVASKPVAMLPEGALALKSSRSLSSLSSSPSSSSASSPGARAGSRALALPCSSQRATQSGRQWGDKHLEEVATLLQGLSVQRRREVILNHLCQTQRAELQEFMRSWRGRAISLSSSSEQPKRLTDSEDLDALAVVATTPEQDAHGATTAIAAAVSVRNRSDFQRLMTLLTQWSNLIARAQDKELRLAKAAERQRQREANLHRRLESTCHWNFMRRKDLTMDDILHGWRPA